MRTTTIKIGDTTYTEGIQSGSLYLNEVLTENQEIGRAYSSMFECVMIVSDVAGQTIQVSQTEDGATSTIFTGIVASAELDSNGMTRKITAYDKLYSLANVNIASWWEEFWTGKETATIKELRNSLLDFGGIPHSDTTFTGDSRVIRKKINITAMKYSELLKMVCEFSGRIPHINRAGTFVFFKLPKASTTTKSLTGLYKSLSNFNEQNNTPDTKIRIFNGQDVEAEGGTGNAVTEIRDNFLIMSTTASLTSIINSLLAEAGDLTTKPGTIEMIQETKSISLGDIVQTEKGLHYVTEITHSGVQLYEMTIKCASKTSYETESTYSTEYELISEASTTASSAQTAANNAQTAADNAQTTANNAQTAANNADGKAQGIINNIYTTGTTTIDGGKITTDSITTDQIAANAITSNEIEAGAITADKMTLGRLVDFNNLLLNTYNPRTSPVESRIKAMDGTTVTMPSNCTTTATTHGYKILTNTGTYPYFRIGTTSSTAMLGMETGKTYTFCFDLMWKLCSGTSSSNNLFAELGYVKDGTTTYIRKTISSQKESDEYKRFYFTFTVPETTGLMLRVRPAATTTGSHASGDFLALDNIMLLEGEVTSAEYTPAKEDLSVYNIYTDGTTTIDGGKITTNTIDANCIKADTVLSNHIQATNLDITGGKVQITTADKNYDYIELKYTNSLYSYSNKFTPTRTMFNEEYSDGTTAWAEMGDFYQGAIGFRAKNGAEGTSVMVLPGHISIEISPQISGLVWHSATDVVGKITGLSVNAGAATMATVSLPTAQIGTKPVVIATPNTYGIQTYIQGFSTNGDNTIVQIGCYNTTNSAKSDFAIHYRITKYN